jgi:hypothetical protein
MSSLRKLAVGALAACAVVAGALSTGATANADPKPPWWPDPPGPGVLPPPGHLQQLPWVPPPGHWPVNPGWVNQW